MGVVGGYGRRGRRGRGRLARMAAVATACCAVLSLLSVVAAEPGAPGAALVRPPGAAAGDVAATGCAGARIPPGFTVAQGYPYRRGAVSGTSFNPQTVAIFAGLVLSGSTPRDVEQTCLARWAVSGLLARARSIDFTSADGRPLTALTFPYPFDFSASSRLPPMRAGWISGLAQGSILCLMSAMYDRTGDRIFREHAEATFNSFLLPPSAGGFVTTVGGLTYLQEYPTSVPSYVLNGHLEATLCLLQWARRSDDPAVADLLRRSLAALRTTLPLGEVRLPTGTVSSYDLLRGYPAAELRVTSPRALAVHASAVTDGAGAARAPLHLAVAAPGRGAPNLLENGGLTAWNGSRPRGWEVSGPTLGTVGPGPVPGTARLTSEGRGTPILYQDVPASAVSGGQRYTASWKALVPHVPGTPSAAGRVALQATCGKKIKELAAADVRSHVWATESIEGQAVAGCGLRLMLYKADPASLRATIDYGAAQLRLSEPVGAATRPSYPLSVVEVPRVFVTVTYSGAGELQGRLNGRWVTIGALPAGRHRTASVEIPDHLQGRNVNLRYHNNHIDELDRLYALSGEHHLRLRALAWMRTAPALEGHRNSLTAMPKTPPGSAA
jgi:hypothetical protein